MEVKITYSNLWLSHYTDYQMGLYSIISDLHDNKNKNFKEISNYLNDYSTVTEYFLNIVKQFNEIVPKSNRTLLFFSFSFQTTCLTNVKSFGKKQQLIFDEVKYLRDELKMSFKDIGITLTEKGYRSVRSNKELLPNYIYSIYTKGKIREERLTKEFDTHVEDIYLSEF